MEALFAPGVSEHLPIFLALLGAVGVLLGALVGVIVKVLSIYKWLVAGFEGVNAAIASLRTAIGDRLASHERDERVWQSELAAKVEDVRERLARMEGQLAASASERVHRRAIEDQHTTRVEE
jgi:hypothetical protein